jgi:hypothetical protein
MALEAVTRSATEQPIFATLGIATATEHSAIGEGNGRTWPLLISFSGSPESNCFLCGGPKDNLVLDAYISGEPFMCHATDFYVNGRYTCARRDQDVDVQWVIPICCHCHDDEPGPSPAEAIVEHRMREKLRRLYPLMTIYG